MGPHLPFSDRLAVVESRMKDLFGNGQPGLMEKMDQRITILENFRWKAIGAMALIVFLTNVLTGSGVVSLERFLVFMNKPPAVTEQQHLEGLGR